MQSKANILKIIDGLDDFPAILRVILKGQLEKINDIQFERLIITLCYFLVHGGDVKNLKLDDSKINSFKEYLSKYEA